MKILNYSLMTLALMLVGCGVMNDPIAPKDFPKTEQTQTR